VTFTAILLLSQLLSAQTPVPPATAPAPAQAVTKTTLRAQYGWGYSGMEGEGKGTLSVLIEPGTGKVVMELHGLGERLMLLSGDQASGYQIQIPRRELDLHGASFGELPLPFLPQLGSADALYKLLTEGAGPGVTVSKRDGKGPVNLRYSGQDEHGKDVMVWLKRTRWDMQTTPAE
jgi:hypothetical protein